MKTFNNLYNKIYDFANLHKAYLQARKCKRYKKEVLEFTNNLEANLIEIQNELIWHKYKPSQYRSFIVREPKERLILCLPFKDRVVQHAIHNVIEPIFEKTFIKDSYACRKGKGTLRGLNRAEKFISKYSSDIYCLKMDIRKYFYTIDHAVLKDLIKRKIRCKETLELLFGLIDSVDNPGLPIGSLLSQLFANVYLGSLDHFIKEELKVKHYVRYMDDMIILSENKKSLQNYLLQINNFILIRLHLSLNSKTQIFPIKRGIDYLGYRQFQDYRILRKRILKSNLKKFKKLIKIGVSMEELKTKIVAFMNICNYCKSESIINKLKNEIIGKEKWEQMYLN
jgi:retron-type reverse transcriptase